MIYVPHWILILEVLLLHARHGNKVCTREKTPKKGAMNSCVRTSALTTKCLSAPSDRLLAPRRPLKTPAERGCKWGEETVRFQLRGDGLILAPPCYKTERFYDLGDAALAPTHAGADGVFEGD